MQLVSFIARSDDNRNDFKRVAAPLFNVKEDVDGRNTVESLFYPFCPYSVSLRGGKLTFAEDAASNFISQCILSMVRQNFSVPLILESDKGVFSYV